MKNPVERIRDRLIAGDTQKAVLVFSERNRRYFTEFPSDIGILLITADEAYLLQDFRYEEAAGYSAKNCKVVGFKKIYETLCELLEKHGVKQVYLEIDKLSVSQARKFGEELGGKGIEAVLDETLDKAIKDQRMIKSPDEVRKIEASQAITDAAFQHILPYIKEGVTERELALEIEFFMRKNGADGVAFDLIVAAGKSGSQCHAVPSDNTVHKGDFITMDTGALLDGYHSARTRTICKDVDKIARDIIEKDYPGTFGHGLGHGVGYEIHEWPAFSSRDETVCQEGMVITDEPGIYLPAQYGVRIEDMLLITADGCRSLTKSPKELIEL